MLIFEVIVVKIILGITEENFYIVAISYKSRVLVFTHFDKENNKVRF